MLFSLKDVLFPDSESCQCDKSDIKKFGFYWLLHSNRLTFYIWRIIYMFTFVKPDSWPGRSRDRSQGGRWDTAAPSRLHTLLCLSKVIFRWSSVISVYWGGLVLHMTACLRKTLEFLQEFPGMLALTEQLLVLFILSLLFSLIRGETHENGI